MVCESDTTIAAGSTVTIGGSETITVASGKKLVVEGTLEIAPYVPGGGTVIIDIGFVED
jgi:predicted S18 family serine protease